MVSPGFVLTVSPCVSVPEPRWTHARSSVAVAACCPPDPPLVPPVLPVLPPPDGAPATVVTEPPADADGAPGCEPAGVGLPVAEPRAVASARTDAERLSLCTSDEPLQPPTTRPAAPTTTMTASLLTRPPRG